MYVCVCEKEVWEKVLCCKKIGQCNAAELLSKCTRLWHMHVLLLLFLAFVGFLAANNNKNLNRKKKYLNCCSSSFWQKFSQRRISGKISCLCVCVYFHIYRAYCCSGWQEINKSLFDTCNCCSLCMRIFYMPHFGNIVAAVSQLQPTFFSH